MSRVRLHALVAALCFAVAGAAQARARVLVLVGGECAEEELQATGSGVWRALSTRPDVAPIEQSELASRLGREGGLSYEDVQRQIDVARTDLYSGKEYRALAQLESLLEEIQHLPLGKERSQFRASVEALNAKVLFNLGRRAEGEMAFRRILRLMPEYKLDPIYFSPSMRQYFQAIGKRVATAPKVSVEVTSNPSGADVYLDGIRVGKTPHVGQYDPGEYTLLVEREGARSFLRKVDLTKPGSVYVDLDFEGRFAMRRYACVKRDDDAARTLSSAMRLGAVVDAERVVLVRLAARGVGRRWLAAALLDVRKGQLVREGGLRFEGLEKGTDFTSLVDFVLTGQEQSAVTVLSGEGAGTPWVITEDLSASAEGYRKQAGLRPLSKTEGQLSTFGFSLLEAPVHAAMRRERVEEAKAEPSEGQ